MYAQTWGKYSMNLFEQQSNAIKHIHTQKKIRKHETMIFAQII